MSELLKIYPKHEQMEKHIRVFMNKNVIENDSQSDIIGLMSYYNPFEKLTLLVNHDHNEIYEIESMHLINSKILI